MPLDVVPDCIVDGLLYIGPKESAANPETLAQRNIKRIIVCCTNLPFYLGSDFEYLRITMNDSLD